MSDFSVELPTVISPGALLQAIARGIGRAVEELGPDYFTVTNRDYGTMKLQIFKVSERPAEDMLSTTQRPPSADTPVWSFEFSDYRPEDSVPEGRKRYLFLSADSAREHIRGLEDETVELVLKAVRGKDKEESK